MTHTHTTELDRVAKQLFDIALTLDGHGNAQRKAANCSQGRESDKTPYHRGAQDAYRHAAGYIWDLFNSIGDTGEPNANDEKPVSPDQLKSFDDDSVNEEA